MPEAKFTINANDKTKAAFKSVRGSIDNVAKRVLSAQSAILGLVGVGGFGALIKSSIDAGDKIDKLSIRLGASTEALSQYQHVAELSGVSFDNLTMGWQRMVRRVAEAADGTGEAKAALQELGLSAQALKKMAPEQQFEALADAFTKVDSQSDKVRLSMKLFDSSGVSLLQTMEGGSAAIRKMRMEADALGKTLSSEQVKKMAQTNDAITRLQATTHGLANTIAIQAGPSIVAFAQSASETLPGAINTAVISLEEMKVAYYDTGIAIHEALKWRDKWDKKILSSIPGGESFFEKHFDYDPDLLRKREEELNHLMMLRDQTNKRLSNIETGNVPAFTVPDNSGFADLNSGAMGNSGLSEETKRQAEEVTKLKEHLRLRVDTIEQSLMTEDERRIFAFERNKATLEDAFINEQITKLRHDEIMEGLEDKHQTALKKIKMKARDANLAVTSDLFGAMAQLAQQGGADSFKSWKMLARAQTYVSTYSAAQKAFESQLIPGDPTSFPRAVAAAAASVTSGLARLASINKASLGSTGGGDAPATGSVGIGGSGGISPVVPTIDNNARESRPAQHVEVHIHGQTIEDMAGLARSLRSYDIELTRDTI